MKDTDNKLIYKLYSDQKGYVLEVCNYSSYVLTDYSRQGLLVFHYAELDTAFKVIKQFEDNILKTY